MIRSSTSIHYLISPLITNPPGDQLTDADPRSGIVAPIRREAIRDVARVVGLVTIERVVGE